MSTIEDLRGRLWSDEPSKVDFLAARAIADADPYAKAGLFSSVRVRAWKWVVNAPAE